MGSYVYIKSKSSALVRCSMGSVAEFVIAKIGKHSQSAKHINKSSRKNENVMFFKRKDEDNSYTFYDKSLE